MVPLSCPPFRFGIKHVLFLQTPPPMHPISPPPGSEDMRIRGRHPFDLGHPEGSCQSHAPPSLLPCRSWLGYQPNQEFLQPLSIHRVSWIQPRLDLGTNLASSQKENGDYSRISSNRNSLYSDPASSPLLGKNYGLSRL